MNDTEPVLEFTAVLWGQEHIDALAVDFPYDVETLYGTRGQVKVKATFDGVPYRGSLAKMGRDCHFLIVTQAVRKHLGGKKAGDTVRVTVQRDLEPRTVEVPGDLAAALAAAPDAACLFETLSYTNRKEYVRWILDARREETRRRRVAAAVEKLLAGKKEP